MLSTLITQVYNVLMFTRHVSHLVIDHYANPRYKVHRMFLLVHTHFHRSIHNAFDSEREDVDFWCSFSWELIDSWDTQVLQLSDRTTQVLQFRWDFTDSFALVVS